MSRIVRCVEHVICTAVVAAVALFFMRGTRIDRFLSNNDYRYEANS